MTAVAAPRLPGHLPSTGDVGVNYVYMKQRESMRVMNKALNIAHLNHISV